MPACGIGGRYHPACDDPHRAELKKDKLRAQMLLQVHDELIFEVPDNEVERTLPVIKSVMQSAPDPAVALHVPLQVDARAADNWEEAH
jgi:DNA polymerase-1